MILDWFMRNAAALLLAIAILIVFGGIWHGIAQLIEMQQQSDAGMLRPPGVDKGMFVYVIASAFGSAALPLFGAAVIWRWDRHTGKREGAPE